jgi:hypothetical protein
VERFGVNHPSSVTVSSATRLALLQFQEVSILRDVECDRLGEAVTADTPVGTLYDPTTYDVFQESKPTAPASSTRLPKTPVAAGDTLVNVALVRE